ncbi:MFS transporter [Aureimonas phyllosphaerae]|uniref:DHA1 family bicyclomycin/chloramphenicol resistance-like MFS transporter n=1 Tax=Aureimonas phyllosphaerae TaxID=1166078 RepID=A0A7W6BTX7_9HYPH|nr:MFS transporter [Aureimonas phyllosphaerae]MBB3937958.1 DHA1 family bicyclomycin/chloramphenicol resistance-like MFS transporter [Aureimonas phyllosphaerae]MBB3961997.1 DHA1 family bicyclomycin/chloramphenicol resistance-like MFS transporter [Aureimonas phyllosphaerae]SFF52662.1 MFS transporter, DHA1 family, bicyclomycin/chloramphenicol resistance protein [Aureimonas phyllosphaerae]
MSPSLPRERIILYASLTALTAISVDALLPGLRDIAGELAPAPPLSTQHIVTLFILGMVFGELLLGPISDAIGRKRALVAGLGVYAIGTLVALFASSLEGVILGRILQGIGVAGPKISTRAMIRDQFEGEAMARVMSFLFSLFILVLMVAPALGQAVIALAGWRGMFTLYLGLALVLGAWLILRQPETLPPERRIPFRPPYPSPKRRPHPCQPAGRASDRGDRLRVRGAAPLSQHRRRPLRRRLRGPRDLPVLLRHARRRDRARLLPERSACRALRYRRHGAGRLYRPDAGWPIHAGYLDRLRRPTAARAPLLSGFAAFFASGILFGNLNAMAMRSLGQLAGLGASLIASGSSLVATLFAIGLGTLYDGTVMVLAGGILLAGAASLLLGELSARGSDRPVMAVR